MEHMPRQYGLDLGPPEQPPALEEAPAASVEESEKEIRDLAVGDYIRGAKIVSLHHGATQYGFKVEGDDTIFYIDRD